MVNKDFFAALDELEKEKRIKKDTFIEALETALVIAYKKHTGTAKAIQVKLVPERSTIKILAYQTVVEQVEDKDTQISLEDARYISRKAKVGDEISTMLDVITQAQIWNRILAEAEKRGMGLVAVTHNMALAKRVCTSVFDLEKQEYMAL